MATHNSLPSTSNSKVWNGIWKLQVPNKVKHFIWRASGECLPMRYNLQIRHVLTNNVCSLCEEHPEDAIHCLWTCDHVKCIWFLDPIFNFPRLRSFSKFCDLVSFMLSESTSSTAALFSMVAWCIWVRRNKIKERQQVWEVGDTVKRAQDLL